MNKRYVYFIKPAGMEGPIKIGCSMVPEERLISLASWSPFPLELVVAVPGDRDLERNIHECFASDFSHHEWFRPSQKLTALMAALKAGTPIVDAIDLSMRTGTIPRKPQGGAGWSATTRVYMSLTMRLYHARKRLRAKTGSGAIWYLPPDLEKILDHAGRHQRMPSDAELARFAEVFDDPENWLLTRGERYGETTLAEDDEADVDSWDDPAIQHAWSREPIAATPEGRAVA